MHKFDQKPIISLSTWFLYLFIGWGAAVLGLFFSTVAGHLLIQAGTSDPLWQLTQGVVFTTLMIVVMIFLQRKMNVNIWEFIRLSSFKKGIPFFFLGASIPIVLVIVGIVIAQLDGLIFKGFIYHQSYFLH